MDLSLGWGQPYMNLGRKSDDKSRAKIPFFMMALVPRFRHPARLGSQLECCATRVGRGQVTYSLECSQFEPRSRYHVYFTTSSIFDTALSRDRADEKDHLGLLQGLILPVAWSSSLFSPQCLSSGLSRSPRRFICVHRFLFIDTLRPDIEGSCHGAMTTMTATMQDTLEWGEEGSEMSPGVQSVRLSSL